MKRFLILILAVSLMIPWMAGCGGSSSSSGGSAGVPNPLAQISLSQFQADTGFDVDLYDGYELGDVYKINTDPVIYGLKITDEDGLEYDVRLAKTDNLVEISGMNYDWTYTNEPAAAEEAVTESGSEPEEAEASEEEAGDEAEAAEETKAEEEEPAETETGEPAEEPEYYLYMTDNGQGMITWYEDEYSWSVSMVNGATKAALDKMYDDLYGMVSF